MLTPSRMIRDAEHFSSKMSKIEGSKDLGEYIVNLVKSKALPQTEALSIPVKEGNQKEEEPREEKILDAAISATPAEPPISPALESQEPSGPEDKNTAPEKADTPADPPLPPTPEQLEAEEAAKKSESGGSSPSTASEEAKLNEIEVANEAMEKELPPTPMEVDERDKMMVRKSG